jgi:uncharacterized protein YhjY with autotransporter beta-barrel domain
MIRLLISLTQIEERAMNSHMLQGRQPFRWVGLLACMLLFNTALQAQTLDEQYDIYLPRKCEEMNFARESFEILPGQAGPNLFAYCNGGYALPSGGPTVVVNTLAGVSSAAGRDASLDKTLQRRAQEIRESLSGTGLFASIDGRNEQQDVTRYEDGRDIDRTVLTLGADRRFGSSGVLGLALRRDDAEGRFASGGRSDAQGYGASLYGSWFPVEGLFVDLSATYGTQKLDIERIVTRRVVTYPVQVVTFPPPPSPPPPPPPITTFDPPPAPVRGETDSREMGADVSIGYDVFLWRLNLGPRLGVSIRDARVDAYTESGATILALAFDEITSSSLRTTAGLLASMPFTVKSWVVTPQLDVNWQHELRDDQQLLSAHFAEDLRPNPTKLVFLNEAPDRDTYAARLSVALTMPHGVSAFIAANKMFGHDYRDHAGVSLGVRWEL